MATGKKSFLIYCDVLHSIDHLTVEEKGILFQHLLEYVNDMNPVLEDRLLLTAWKPIERQLKRDLIKYENRRSKNSANARKRWDKENAIASNRIQTDANHADNDNDNDNDKVIDIDIKKEIIVKNEFSQEVLNCYDLCLNFFEKHLHPKNEKIKNQWIETIDKLNRIDKIPFEKIIEIVKFARNHEFWRNQFLSLPKLRKNNRDGVKYIVVFNELMSANGKVVTLNRQTKETIESNMTGWDISQDKFDKFLGRK